MSYIYLASPYSHPDPRVRRERYFAAQDCVTWMLARKIWVYSPIVHCHFMAIDHELPKDATFWREYNRVMLKSAVALWILQISGWMDSEGVYDEVESAEEFNLPNGRIKPTGDGTYTHTTLNLKGLKP